MKYYSNKTEIITNYFTKKHSTLCYRRESSFAMQKQWKILIFVVISLKCCVTAPIDIYEEISKYKDVADKIIQYAVYGAAQNQSYNRLAKFTDMFGNRVAGSQNLENSIDYILHSMMSEGLENVHGEHVKVPRWVRGKESATMLEPQYHEMAILGLGSSIATPKNGIKAEVLVVNSFEELRKKAQMAEGKIVVFNQKWISYGETVQYRTQGASEAAKVGALACLIRSVTPFSIYSPHTGHQYYSEGVRKIPTACITVEDAEMMERMSKRGSKIVVVLKMSAQTLNSTDSRNIVAEVVGHKYPEQTVLVSGHIDSWDVGQGAMDDGGGAFISWQAITILHELGLRPKRTVRAVLWTAEEEGYVGSSQYFERHKNSVRNYSLVMESDEGTFTPEGLYFTGSKEAGMIMKEVLLLLKPINASRLVSSKVSGDISFWVNEKVPGATLMNKNGKYFYFHHTNADTITVQDPHQMNLCAAVWAVVAYVVADLQNLLPL
ncbi:Hypothetical predicted protein [Octopus vulgaris]|uniref:Carboxypeptidase Q n=3 Tax=Octopus TaxID=6643 RepID=A0AA36B8Y0_OCTVU|nr:Hypothetical predicted protein [Octopus vulgaris]